MSHPATGTAEPNATAVKASRDGSRPGIAENGGEETEAPAHLEDHDVTPVAAAGLHPIFTPRTRIPRKPRRPLLVQVLAGRIDCLEALPEEAAPMVFRDASLDEIQREVVAGALRAPDLFFIQGVPGAGKSRVVTELVDQAGARGLRTLLVAARAAAVDRVLAGVAGRNNVLPLRLAETGQELPAAVRSLGFSEQAERLVFRPLARARKKQEQSAVCRRRLEGELSVLAEMRTLAARWSETETERQHLLTQRQMTREQIQQELSAAQSHSGVPAPFAAAVADERQRHEAALEQLHKEQQDAEAHAQARRSDHHHWHTRVSRQTRIVNAKEQKRFYTWAWWRGLFQSRAKERLAEFQCRLEEASRELQAAEARSQDLLARQTRESQHHEQAVEHLLEAETAHRHTDIDQQLKRLTDLQESVRSSWTAARQRLDSATSMPEMPAPEAVETAWEPARARLIQATEETDLAKKWRDSLEGLAHDLDRRLPECFNLVAGTFAGLTADKHFGNNRDQGGSFDIVIVEQADLAAEKELLAAADRAERCVLVGRPPVLQGAAAGHASPFHRLWNTLHCDPRRLPYQWRQDVQAITCQLTPITPEQRPYLECEHLADRPDVELRILALPHSRPFLAEVVFPTSTFTIDAAKAYLFRHLEELAVSPETSGIHWRQRENRLVLQTALPRPAREEVHVAIADGVEEVVHSTAAPGNGRDAMTWLTGRLEFDLECGWTRCRAEEWLRERAGLRDFGRTGLLETPWRSPPELASFWGGVLGWGADRGAGQLGSTNLRGWQFVAVPATGPARRQSHDPKLGKTPAGLEIDLGDAKQRQRLPAELRNRLPVKGIVNLSEAQVVLRRLSALTAKPELLSCPDCQRDRQQNPALAVLAFGRPQVQLLSLLWQQAGHTAKTVEVMFETAAAFRDREASAVLVSLCRSKEGRAAAYAEEPADWSTMLTAARTALILFGDAGALASRSQWRGALSPQSETAAEQERILSTRLLEQLLAKH